MKAWLAVVVMASPATAAPRFDLICTGTTRTLTTMPSPKDETRPFSDELRIDLVTQQYCMAKCLLPRPIYTVVANSIIFERSVDTPSHAGKAVHHWLYRPTGEYLFSTTDVFGAGTTTEARCRTAPFKGMPVRPAKF